MLVFGHLGFGSALARPVMRGLQKRWVLVGTLLPDLVDKPLYYALSLGTGRVGADLGLISGTRTFGHTGLFLLLVLVAAAVRRSKPLLALAVGMGTHAPLDMAMDFLSRPAQSSALLAFLFPLRGLRFGVIPFQSPQEHLAGVLDPGHLLTEALGLALLVWAWARPGESTPRSSSH